MGTSKKSSPPQGKTPSPQVVPQEMELPSPQFIPQAIPIPQEIPFPEYIPQEISTPFPLLQEIKEDVPSRSFASAPDNISGALNLFLRDLQETAYMDRIDKNPQHLSRYVSIVEHILRSHVSHETGVSPFQARFGYKPILWNDIADNDNNFLKKTHDEIITIIAKHKNVIQQKRIVQLPQRFAIGDYVILQREPGIKHPHGKFKHLGPYLITEINNEIILVKNLINGTLTPYHSERLLPFNGDSTSAINTARIGQSEQVVTAILGHSGTVHHRSHMDFQVKWADDSISFLPFSEASKLVIFADYCTANSLSSLLLTKVQADMERSKIDKTSIIGFNIGDLIYVHLNNWSENYNWYTNLHLPQQEDADYIVQGQIEKILGKHRNKCTIYLQFFNERYTITHSDLLGYDASKTIDFSKQILVTPELIILHPQITKLNTSSMDLEFIPTQILQNR